MYGEVIQTQDGRDWRTTWWEDQIARFITLYTPNTSAPDQACRRASQTARAKRAALSEVINNPNVDYDEKMEAVDNAANALNGLIE